MGCEVAHLLKRLIFTVLFLVSTTSCKGLDSLTNRQAISSTETVELSLCPPLPTNFKESDLIGKWIANYGLHDEDLLIIKEDGTYKQIYINPDEGKKYASDWMNWWIEYRDSGYIRLHFTGMKRAGELDSIFNREGGGIDPQLFTAIDYCENEVIEMPDEVVLIVTGSKENNPRGIILRQTRLAGSEWTWSFHLQDDSEPPKNK